MSVVVVGLSHRSAPMAVLESVALSPERVGALAEVITSSPHVAETVVVATCNRLEVYAAAHTFHGAVDDIGGALVEVARLPRESLADHLYVHFGEGAIGHAFAVASGLDSMAVGEAQILGQLRAALRLAQDDGVVGPELNALFQHALRVGKRAHSDTDIDRVSVSLVEAGLDEAREMLGPLAGVRALVVGAGAMSSLAATSLVRAGCRDVTITNRTHAKAIRLAEWVGATSRPLPDLEEALGAADLVVTCTGAVGFMLDLTLMGRVAGRRSHAPQLVLDLALPRDVDPRVEAIPGVAVLSLAELGALISARESSHDAVAAVEGLVAEEVEAYQTSRRATAVAPTVAALRARANDVMAAELERLAARLPGVDDEEMAQIRQTVHRVVEKLLHTPTVRVKELHESENGDYARALRELFDLDPKDVAAISTATGPIPVVVPGRPLHDVPGGDRQRRGGVA